MFKKKDYKFVIFKDTNGEWRFRLVAPNLEIISVSEGYKSKAMAKKTMKTIIGACKGM